MVDNWIIEKILEKEKQAETVVQIPLQYDIGFEPTKDKLKEEKEERGVEIINIL